MVPKLAQVIQDLSSRMRLFKAKQEDQSPAGALTDRELMILGLLNEHGKMNVLQISAADPTASDSTISTTITKLWRDKKMVTKTIRPENQRRTIVELTKKGKKAIEVFNKQRDERLKTLFDAINVTGEETETMIKVLTRAIKFFDKHLSMSNTVGMKQNTRDGTQNTE